MPRFFRRLALSAAGLAAVGCGTSVSMKTPTTAVAKAVPTGPVALTETTTAGLEKAVAAEKGKVVLLDAWFLACGPCVAKFPHVVELAEKYGSDGLTVMSVNVMEDELKSQPDVLTFLKDKKAAFPNYILSDPDEFLKKYNFMSTPKVILIDRAGKRVALPERATDDEVEVAIRAALAAGA